MPDEAVVDIIGVGFGPSNLALAVALAERPEQAPRALFVEQKPAFSWHPGMLLDGSRAQVPFFKDLATMRNPTSRFTYLNWLHERGLLFEFVSSRDFTPMRSELDAYYRWAADQFADQVRYGHRVVSLEPVESAAGEGRITRLRAEVEDLATGRRTTVRARHAVLAPGGTPYVPACAAAALGPHVFHTTDFLGALGEGYPERDRPYRFVIVGAGQSAGDTARYLLDEYPKASVELVFRGYAPRPLDESPFVNELFDPPARELMLSLSPAERDALRTEHHFANYSAIDESLLAQLYRRRLTDSILGRSRLRLSAFKDLVGVTADGAEIAVTVRDRLDGQPRTLPADGVVLATGYHRRPALLDGLREFIELAPDGTPEAGADYRLRTRPGFDPAIFVQGLSEATHGLSDTLLSLIAVRAGEIVDTLSRQDTVTHLRPHAGGEHRAA